MNRRKFLTGLTGGLSALMFQGVSRANAGGKLSASMPNIVLIVADDLGYNHLGCYGGEKIRTPNIDQLAEKGILFTQAYAGCTVCAPSRSSLLTGTHTGHTPVRGNSGGIPLLPEEVTIGEVLQQAGYTTGVFGKWGLGDARTTGVPMKQGFDEFFGSLDQVHAHFYYPEYLWHNEEKYPLPGNEGNKREQYSNDLFTDFALDFIRQMGKDDQPFFCYIPFTIPHTELLVPEDSLNEYLGKFPEEPFEYRGHYAGQEAPRAAFAAMITRMDEYVGKINALIESMGIEDNTLIIFTSDNGGQRSGAGVDLEFFEGNWPLRGAKGDLYEGGIRVPAIARWPGAIPENRVNSHVWAFWDLMATFADLAGVPAPDSSDGLSFAPALLGESAPEHDYLYWEFDRRKVTGPDGVTRPNPEGNLRKAVRMGDWKAVRHQEDQPIELYYLPTDIGEKFDRAEMYPEKVKKFEQIFLEAHVDARPQIEPESGNERLYR